MPTHPGFALHSGLRMSFAGLTHLQSQQVAGRALLACLLLWVAGTGAESSLRGLCGRVNASTTDALQSGRQPTQAHVRTLAAVEYAL
jgi:hypothetical protein